MFFKLATLTLVIPLISALTLKVPQKLSSGGQGTFTWTTDAGDPAFFVLELLNTAFHDSFAIGNNVATSALSITLELPIVAPGDGYTVEAVAISNITDVLSTTSSFSIAAQGSITTSSSSASSSTSGSKSTSSSSQKIPSTSSGSTSGFGVTASASSTSITPAGTGTGTGTPTAAAAATSTTSATFNAASPLKFGFNAGSTAVLLLSALAGAAVMAL